MRVVSLAWLSIMRPAERGPRDGPTSSRLIAQVHHDHPENVQSIYDAIPMKEKKLVWIEGITRRFQATTTSASTPK